MRDIVDVIEDSIFKNINGDLKITTLIIGPIKSKIGFCGGNKWLKIGSQVSFMDENVSILDIDEESITVGNFINPIVLGDIITITSMPYWMNGTQIVVNEEMKLKAQSDLRRITPMVWFSEVIEEDFLPWKSPYERESKIVLFLLDEIENNSMNDVKRSVGVKPMLNLFAEIKRVVDAGIYGVGLSEDAKINVKTFSEFGVENNKGIFNMILDANLGGLVVSMTLNVDKEKCKEC